MMHGIGEAAGQVWQHLHDKGPSSLKALGEATGLKSRELNRAIGWLAREDKIELDNNEKQERVSPAE